MKKILITFSTSFKSLMNFSQTAFNINSFLYSLFHILITKTYYDQLENLKRIEKKIEKSFLKVHHHHNSFRVIETILGRTKFSENIRN